MMQISYDRPTHIGRHCATSSRHDDRAPEIIVLLWYGLGHREDWQVDHQHFQGCTSPLFAVRN